MTPEISNSPHVVLITGCDTGIGYALAEAFHRRGRHVIATGLRPAEMTPLNEQGIDTERLDVTSAEEITALTTRLEQRGLRVDILVNNAGYGAMGPVLEMPLADAVNQYRVNVFGLLAMTQAFADDMADRRRGTIVNIGSTSGVLTTPFAGIYCSTKAAVHAINDALRMELAPFGVDVIRVEPNMIRTAFGDTAAAGLAERFRANSRYAAAKEAAIGRAQGSQTDKAMSAAEFADRVVTATLADKPATRVRLGRELWPYTVFKPFVPSRLVDRVLMKRFALSKVGSGATT